MKEQAAVLVKLVSRFKLGDTGAQAAPTPITPLQPAGAPAQARPRQAGALPPAHPAALAPAPRKARPASGEWEEF